VRGANGAKKKKKERVFGPGEGDRGTEAAHVGKRLGSVIGFSLPNMAQKDPEGQKKFPREGEGLDKESGLCEFEKSPGSSPGSTKGGRRRGPSPWAELSFDRNAVGRSSASWHLEKRKEDLGEGVGKDRGEAV